MSSRAISFFQQFFIVHESAADRLILGMGMQAPTPHAGYRNVRWLLDRQIGRLGGRWHKTKDSIVFFRGGCALSRAAFREASFGPARGPNFAATSPSAIKEIAAIGLDPSIFIGFFKPGSEQLSQGSFGSYFRFPFHLPYF